MCCFSVNDDNLKVILLLQPIVSLNLHFFVVSQISTIANSPIFNGFLLNAQQVIIECRSLNGVYAIICEALICGVSGKHWITNICMD